MTTINPVAKCAQLLVDIPWDGFDLFVAEITATEILVAARGIKEEDLENNFVRSRIEHEAYGFVDAAIIEIRSHPEYHPADPGFWDRVIDGVRSAVVPAVAVNARVQSPTGPEWEKDGRASAVPATKLDLSKPLLIAEPEDTRHYADHANSAMRPRPDIDFRDVRTAARNNLDQLIDELIPISSRGKRNGDELCACNPTRSDKNPTSFSINTKTGLFNDFATEEGGDIFKLWKMVKGLTSDTDAIFEIAEFLRVLPSRSNRSENVLELNKERLQDEPSAKKKAEPLGREVAAYDYTGADGTLLYQVVRYDPKAFRQRRPDGRGGWIHKLGEERVVYRWPEIAKHPDANVFVCEGEKDADRVASLGHCSTTIAGDGKWTVDCVDALAGRHIFILEDNDLAGHKKALAAAMALHGKVASIRIVRLPGLGDKGDVSDWLDADPANARMLGDVCVGVPEWIPGDRDQEIAPDLPPPVDLWAKFSPPSLPPGMLPHVIESYAIAQGRVMGADIAGIAAAAIAVCAAAIPDRIQVQVKKHNTGWLESSRLWVALVGPPSTMKSPMISAAVAPLMKIDAEMARKNSEARAKYDKLPPKEKRQTNPPQQMQLMLQDTTIEAAQEIFKDSPDGLLIYQDELSGFFGAMDKYSGARGASKDRAFWLQSFNGGVYSVHRIGRGATYIPNLSASILGGIQPEAIRQVAAECVDDGLLQRLLPIILQPAVLGQDEPLSEEAIDYAKLIRNLHNLREAEPLTLKYDEGAQKIRQELEGRHLELLSCETINKKLSAHIGKYNGIFARLCVVFHCIDHAGDVLPAMISEATAKRVAGFLHAFLLPHALAFYAGVLGLSDDHDRLTAVAGFILAHKRERMTNRDVQRGDRTMRDLKRPQTEAIFEQLEAMGWVGREPGFRPGPGAQATSWIVNPAVHTEFADRAKTETERRARDRKLLAGLFGKK